MSLGGAAMIVGENLEPSRGRTVLFMLALLEVGAVALSLRSRFLERGSHLCSCPISLARRSAFPSQQRSEWASSSCRIRAKLGLLPFYEWFPGAYGSGSGASGAIMSGVVLNAAFFALSRALFNWLPAAPDGPSPPSP